MNRFESLGNLIGLGNGFERSSSVDDLMGGIFRLSGQAGLARSESEAAFQEFLKKIPSATNLAAIGAAAQQAGTDLGANGTSQAMDAAANGGNGMTRVPSLDFLRSLVVNQRQPANGTVKLEQNLQAPGAIGNLGGAELAFPGWPASFLNNPPDLSALLHHGNGGHAMKLPSISPNLQHRTTSSTPMSSDGGGGRSMGELDDKAEARRARSHELNVVAGSKNEIEDQVTKLGRQLGSIEEENRSLRDENERLKDELHFLRTEISERKPRRPSPSSPPEADAEEAKMEK
eukprot:gene30631-35644_t